MFKIGDIVQFVDDSTNTEYLIGGVVGPTVFVDDCYYHHTHFKLADTTNQRGHSDKLISCYQHNIDTLHYSFEQNKEIYYISLSSETKTVTKFIDGEEWSKTVETQVKTPKPFVVVGLSYVKSILNPQTNILIIDAGTKVSTIFLPQLKHMFVLFKTEAEAQKYIDSKPNWLNYPTVLNF